MRTAVIVDVLLMAAEFDAVRLLGRLCINEELAWPLTFNRYHNRYHENTQRLSTCQPWERHPG